MDKPPQATQIKVNLDWPADTYLDAEPCNSFVFNDIGDNVCLAFGFAPPPPGIESLAQGGEVRVTVDRKTAVLVPKSLLLMVRQSLGEYIDNNPQLFGLQVLGDDATDSD
ncbi:hypothetical protein A5725_24610 [Mycobacterium kubicae]|uniref:hypothetical protein n=1 Tax=Mycobacterium kubicae TaxID=120959 RepID=UPI0008009F5C|nr:hypothetical protein [Mycobacterium kubicae]OBF17204.1 hypothetical protein A5725_24610 [Mycobacterium kubicae]